MLLDHQMAFSQSSRSIKDEEYQKVQERGFTLKEIPVAIDGIAIAVHPDLNIPGLTLAQIKDISTGKVTNWEQMDDPNLPITPYSRLLKEGGTTKLRKSGIWSDPKKHEQIEKLLAQLEA